MSKEKHQQKEHQKDRKIRRLNFRIIEAEIVNYHQSKKQLSEYVANLQTITLPGRNMDETGITPKGGMPGDPTARQAIKLAEAHEMVGVMQEMARRVEAIEWALGRLTENHRKLVKLYYWSPKYYTPDGIARELNSDRRTFFRWKRQIVHLIAQRLGWKV